MRAGIGAPTLESHDEVRARVDRGNVGHLHGIEDAENIELPLLREVGGVAEQGE
ncbi:MAG: hypothetical protein M3125_01430 [Gemmatimonadota bacterium]|nr:hypothetical protein [Gemmatimonadota bacterium]